MSRTWSILAGLCAALLSVALTAFLVDRVDSTSRLAIDQLGYSGESVRITAILADGTTPDAGFTDAIVAYTREQDLSVASTRWYDSGVVTMVDPDGSFRNSQGAISPAYHHKDASSSILLASSIDNTAAAVLRALGETTSAPTRFTSDVMFEGRYPIAIVGPDVVPFDSGVFLFAGNEIEVGDIVALFERNGLSILDAAHQPRVDFSSTIGRAVASPYGVIVTFFWATLALCAFLITRMFTVLRRRRYAVAKTLGALPRDLRRMVISDVGPAISFGLGLGAAASVGLVLTTVRISAAPASDRMMAAAISTFVAAALSVAAIAWAAHLEARGADSENSI